jgi:hypothetical protein
VKPWERFAAEAAAPTARTGTKPWDKFAAEAKVEDEAQPAADDSELRRLQSRGELRQQELKDQRTEFMRNLPAAGRALAGAGLRVGEAAASLAALPYDLLQAQRPEWVDRTLATTKEQIEAGGTAAQVGSVLGDVAMLAVPGSAVAKGLKGAGALARGLGVIGTDAAVAGATAPEDRLQAAALTAAGSAAGQGVARVLGGALKPSMTPEAARLLEQGVVPTPGQAIGGVLNRAEQKAMSVPIVGDVIGNARARAVRDLNKAAIGSVEGRLPGAEPIREIGDEALTKLGKQIGETYEAALKQIDAVKITPKFEEDVLRGVLNPELLIDPATQSRVLKEVDELVLRRAANGGLDAQTAKGLDSLFGYKAASLRGSPNPTERDLGKAYEAVRDALRGAITDSAPESARKMLEAANRGWRQYRALDDAAASAIGQNVQSAANAAQNRGVFTPHALRRALQKADKTINDHAIRSGNAGSLQGLNELSDAAARVLGSNVPDSGTAGRLLLPGAVAGAALAPGSLASTAAGAAAAAGAYTRGGTRALLGDLPGQRAIDSVLQKTQAARLAGAAGGAAAARDQQSSGNPLRAADGATRAAILSRDIAQMVGNDDAARQIAAIIAQQPGAVDELAALPADLYQLALRDAVARMVHAGARQ